VRRLLVVTLLVAPVALAQDQYTYLAFKNLADAQNPFPYYVDNRNPMPANLAVANVRAAAESAWGKWNAVSCAVPKSVSLGFTGSTVPDPIDPYDMFNTTPVFVTDGTHPYFNNIFGPGIAAVTLPLHYTGMLQQCDVYLNATLSVPWSTQATTPFDALDVETVVLHETGHCLGINHPNDRDAVMVASILPGENKRNLSTFDVGYLCNRYPAVGQVGSPCPDGGGCISPNKCVTQAQPSGPPVQYCTRGCSTGVGEMCEVPLVCQSSTVFAPAKDGACVRPNTAVTQISRPCMNDPECGSSSGICRRPEPKASGTTFWIGGYCYQDCSPGRPPCPPGSQCIMLGTPQQPDNMCLLSCRVGFADCRPGYACANTSVGGVCVPRCESNDDCIAGYACRVCDGLCVSVNSPSQPGDVCMNDDQCGLGQSCIRVSPSSDTQMCSQSCGLGCQTCPGNSTCHPVPTAGGQFFCLRNCSGPATCPVGLVCSNLATGRACLPPCQNNRDCAVGTVCDQGTCTVPMADGGCGLLCQTEDSGSPVRPRPRDAGTGGGGSGGCGCNSSPASLLFALMGLVLVRTRSMRSRSCRPRQ